MTAMELQQWKKNFIRNYLDKIDSLEMMDKLEKSTKRILNKKAAVLSPIAFSIEEGKGIKEPEMHQFFEEWRKKLK